MEIVSKFFCFQGLNQESQEDDSSHDDEEEDEKENDVEEGRHLSKKSSDRDVEMDGPTRDELEQTAEGQFNLSDDEDATGIAKFFHIKPYHANLMSACHVFLLYRK
jgi:hypothetical protein